MYLPQVLAFLVSLVLAVPSLQIAADYSDLKTNKDKTVSFSSQINFADKTIPGDKSKMSDGQLINLAKVAYLEMMKLLDDASVPAKNRPATMAAMVSEGSIYFASSMRQVNRDTIITEFKERAGSPLDYINRISNNAGSHEYGGCCAEVNVLMFHDRQLRSGLNVPFQQPPINDTPIRVAVWMRTRKGPQKAVDPCIGRGEAKYGCEVFKKGYGLQPVQLEDPDDKGQDDWKFDLSLNKRIPSQCPP